MYVVILMCLSTHTFAINQQTPCDTDKCKLPLCRCPGTDIPGGLLPVDIPQMVVFTFDDAINEQVRDILDPFCIFMWKLVIIYYSR